MRFSETRGTFCHVFFFFLFAGIQVEFRTFVRVPLRISRLSFALVCSLRSVYRAGNIFSIDIFCLSLLGRNFKERGTHTQSQSFIVNCTTKLRKTSLIYVSLLFSFLPFSFSLLPESTSVKHPFNFCEYSLFSHFISVYISGLRVFFIISAWQKSVNIRHFSLFSSVIIHPLQY